jgi:hypothetical protein
MVTELVSSPLEMSMGNFSSKIAPYPRPRNDFFPRDKSPIKIPIPTYILHSFLFICRWIVQNYTIQRHIKRNGGSIYYHKSLCEHQIQHIYMRSDILRSNYLILSLTGMQNTSSHTSLLSSHEERDREWFLILIPVYQKKKTSLYHHGERNFSIPSSKS